MIKVSILQFLMHFQLSCKNSNVFFKLLESVKLYTPYIKKNTELTTFYITSMVSEPRTI